MSVGLAWKSVTKNDEKLVNQKYATLFLYLMPFSKKYGKMSQEDTGPKK